MVFNATFNNISVISWWSIILMEETRVISKFKTSFSRRTVCQRLATGRWFSLDTPVSSTNKTDCDDITEILLKVALNTINQSKHS
jgi:hypothetical protein